MRHKPLSLYDRHRRDHTFQVGDLVKAKTLKPNELQPKDMPSKFAARFTGPWKILKAYDNDFCLIERYGQERRLAADNLRPWLTNKDYRPPPDLDPGPPDIHLPLAVPIPPVEPATMAPNAVHLGVPRPVITSDAGPRISPHLGVPRPVITSDAGPRTPPADANLHQPSEPPLVVPSDTTSIPTPGVPRVLVPPVSPVQTPGVGNKGSLSPPNPTVHLDDYFDIPRVSAGVLTRSQAQRRRTTETPVSLPFRSGLCLPDAPFGSVVNLYFPHNELNEVTFLLWE
jgi:hypothetical protein